jgi:hypothetical protein
MLVVTDCGKHEDEVWLGDTRLLKCLLGGLTTCDARIVMVAHADSGFGSLEYTS